MILLDEFENQLADAKANYETLLAEAPDEQAAQAEITAYRLEYHEKTRREEKKLEAVLAELREEKCRREAEFTEIQLTAKALKNAKAEVIRATRQLARAQITHAGDLRRDERSRAKAADAREEAHKAVMQELYDRHNEKFLADCRARQAEERARGITDGSDAGNAARAAWLVKQSDESL